MGTLYYPPEGDPIDITGVGNVNPPSVYTMFIAGLRETANLELYDVDDPGGVVFRDPPGGGGGVTYWRAERASATSMRFREVAAAGGGAGTGVNDADYVSPFPFTGKLGKVTIRLGTNE